MTLSEVDTTISAVCAAGLSTPLKHPDAQREIVFSTGGVAFSVQRSRRRSIGLVVCEQGLTVCAPQSVPWSEIEAVIRAKEKWIGQKLAEQRERARLREIVRIDWRVGGCMLFLGGSLKIALHPGLKRPELLECPPGPVAEGGLPTELVVGVDVGMDPSPKAIKDLLTPWLKQYALAHFKARVQYFAVKLQVRVTRLVLSSARTRWGSACSDGSIRLHWGLIHFDPDVIDYVVVHELAHLREMNHGPRFWSLVAATLPEYEVARQRLKHAVLPH